MKYRHLILILLFVLFAFNSQNFAQTANSVSLNQIEGIELEEEEIFDPYLCSDIRSRFFTTEKPVGVRTKIAEQRGILNTVIPFPAGELLEQAQTLVGI